MKGPERVDVLVAGAGVMGSAVALELAQRNRRVTVLERSPEGVRAGASGGRSRVLRFSYEDPAYIDLARSSWRAWGELERQASKPLLERRGSIEFGGFVRRLARIWDAVGVSLERVTPRRAWELYSLRIPTTAVYVSDAGVLVPDAVVETQVELARRHGASFVFGDGLATVSDWRRSPVSVTSCAGRKYVADVVVMATGRWLRGMCARLGIRLPLFFKAERLAYLSGSFARAPVVIDWRESGRYFVPMNGGRIAKTAVESVEVRTVALADGPASPVMIRRALRWTRELTGQRIGIRSWEKCITTHAHGRDFILDRIGNLGLMSACSGHGFKFAPILARIMADMVEGRRLALARPILARWSLAAHSV
ncbi:MAG: FAD-dependent oxidoreductase [Candidatus Eisenbacteria bacterium]|uniref:FAD-dependent oxidoreductase n=1 Tax=Eiseniibacteriota bacterium TaxID=2212470 RepID=A0A538U3V9_UNCEI|nr:MAG: FAD-dependent oxidoreductase [Candidatus Eisenbacteria bacterium]